MHAISSTIDSNCIYYDCWIHQTIRTLREILFEYPSISHKLDLLLEQCFEILVDSIKAVIPF